MSELFAVAQHAAPASPTPQRQIRRGALCAPSSVRSVLSVVLLGVSILVLQAAPLQGKPAQQSSSGQKYSLKATPKTVVYGHYSAKTPPVLRVKSGDTVDIETLITSNPKDLEGAGVPPAQVEQSLRAIENEVKERGPGGHILTGPVYIEGAEPGDVLEVRILGAKLAIPYAYNGFWPGNGYLPNDFPYEKMKIIPLDEKRMVAHFAPGIEIPLHPFFGSMGIAPPASAGRFSSNPPWIMAGNLDNKELVVGTTLYIPVHAQGALFEVGDGHAGQGDGEVDITALETSLVGTFQFIVRKDMHLKWPRAETPTHYISMGFDDRSEHRHNAGRPRNDRLPSDGEAPLPRRRLHALQRSRRPAHHRTSRRQQRRPHDAPQIRLHRAI